MTYRSSEAQLANLKPGASKKGEVARDAFVSAKITTQNKAILQEHLKKYFERHGKKKSVADLLEAIGEKLGRDELSIDDFFPDENREN